MRVTILCVGKIKEKFYRDALEEYGKRLGKYCKFEVIEVSDEQTPDKASAAVEEMVKAREAERLLNKIKDGMYICTLEINGRKLSSEEFAEKLQKETVAGNSHFCFIIGGSLGLHSSVTQIADFHLSFSDMTFPHQLMRVILAEQIYRAFRIINKEPYHK